MSTTTTSPTPTQARARAARRRQGMLMIVLLAIALVAPLFAYPVFLMKVLCFALFACAFNLLLGFVEVADGMLSLNGHPLTQGLPTGTATWTPTLTTTTQYAIYATWQSTASRATSALYTLHHAGGTSTVAADQTVNSNQWNLLGTVTMAPGQNHRVVLTESVTGTTIADAVQFVPFNGARNRASWTPSVLAHEDYEVYARWAASSPP